MSVRGVSFHFTSHWRVLKNFENLKIEPKYCTSGKKIFKGGLWFQWGNKTKQNPDGSTGNYFVLQPRLPWEQALSVVTKEVRSPEPSTLSQCQSPSPQHTGPLMTVSPQLCLCHLHLPSSPASMAPPGMKGWIHLGLCSAYLSQHLVDPSSPLPICGDSAKEF